MYNDSFLINIDSINPSLMTLSIVVTHNIVDTNNNNIIGNVGNIRQGFVPGQLSEVLSFIEQYTTDNNIISNITSLLNSIWTSNVINNYNNAIQST